MLRFFKPNIAITKRYSAFVSSVAYCTKPPYQNSESQSMVHNPPMEAIRRRFVMNGAIDSPSRRSYFYADPSKQNSAVLIPKIRAGDYFLLYGCRGTGKTTKIYRLVEQLSVEFCAIYVTMAGGISTMSSAEFWSAITEQMRLMKVKFPICNSSKEFMRALSLQNMNEYYENKRVVLIIDEFDAIFKAPELVQQDVLGTFRSLKQLQTVYCLRSVIGVGPFGILELTGGTGSPFHIGDSIENPNVTWEAAQDMFREFTESRTQKFDPRIFSDIFRRTNGHLGFIGYCGIQLDDVLAPYKARVSWEEWLSFASGLLSRNVIRWAPMRALVGSILEYNSQVAADARDLLMTHLFPAIGPVVVPMDKLRIAKYLAREGALVCVDNEFTYTFPNTFTQNLLLGWVVDIVKIAHPATDPICDGKLDMMECLLEALPFFDSHRIHIATTLSYKFNRVPGISRETKVPREVIYHFEHFAILRSWLKHLMVVMPETNVDPNPLLFERLTSISTSESKASAQAKSIAAVQAKAATGTKAAMGADDALKVDAVTGAEETVQRKPNQKYCDTIVVYDNRKYIFEYVATTTVVDVEEHVAQAAFYAHAQAADEAMVVHFTTVRQSEKYKYPFPSPHVEAALKKEVGDIKLQVVHVWHNVDFTEVNVFYKNPKDTKVHMKPIYFKSNNTKQTRNNKGSEAAKFDEGTANVKKDNKSRKTSKVTKAQHGTIVKNGRTIREK